MKHHAQRRRVSTVGGMAVLTLCACVDVEPIPPERVYGRFDTPANCSDFIEVCSDVTPRVEVTVTDESGAPVQHAFLNSYYPSWNPTFLDETRFPTRDAIGKARSYFVCSNDEGKASLCGIDEGYPPLRRHITVWKSGYATATDVDPRVEIERDEVRRKEIVLGPAPLVEQTSKVMFVACQTGDETRLPHLLVDEGVRFTVPRLGEAVSELVPDPDNPLAAFDTLILDMSCNRYEAFEELVLPEKKQRVWDWIRAGGRLFVSEINSDTWNAAAGECTEACGRDFFDPPYEFELISNKNANCDSYEHGAIAAPGHPLVQGVSLDDWSYQEYQGDESVSRALGWGAIRKQSVDPAAWRVLVTASSDQDELDDKVANGCFQDTPELARPNGAVLLMEAHPGKGHILVGGLAWIQGSAGERTNQEFSPDAVRVKDHIIDEILGR